MKFLAAYVAVIAGAAVTAIALGLIFGRINLVIAIAALVVGVVMGCLAAHQVKGFRFQLRGLGTWAVILAFVLYTLRAFLWLVFTDGDEVRVLSPNNLGDMSLHLTYIRHLAAGGRFWPDNPIFAGENLRYPIGIDLFNSLLSVLGVDDFRGLIATGLAGSAATAIALLRWGRGFALAGLLCNGGLAGLAFFASGELRDYQADLAWKSIPLAMLVTQRAFLYALPAGLLLLCAWRARFFHRAPIAPLWLEIALYASMPLFHIHTFLFLSALMAFWLLEREWRTDVSRQLAFAFLPATALVALVTGGFAAGGGLHWQPGWMQHDDGLWFWGLNFGIWPLAVAALCVYVWRRHQREAAAFVFPSLALFVVACFVMLSPWPWDNTKIMIWAYLALMPFLWEMLRGLLVVWRAVVCFGLFASGFISLAGGLDSTHQGEIIAERAELDALHEPLTQLPIDAVFAGWPTWNHPLLLSGRKVSLGYDGHLWSHGINYQPRMRRFKDFMNGEPGWRETTRELGIRYLYWGKRETQHYPDSLRPWEENGRLVATGTWGSIYELP